MKRHVVQTLAIAATVVTLAVPAAAATYTWTGATDTLWTTTTNWNPNASVGGPTSADSLVFTGSTNATVNLEGAARTVTNIASSGMTLPLTVTATNGSLTINGGNQSFGTQANGSLVTDYSGLSSFTFTQTGTNTFDVRMTIPAAGPTSGTATLRLATQGSGTNFIRASNVQVGAAAGASNGTAWGGVLSLGKANTLHATTLAIGGFNGSGAVAFQPGVSGGTLVLRGTAGGSSRVTTMDVGATSSGSRDGSGTLDLTGGTLDAMVTTLTVGRHGAGANNATTNSLTMPGGSLDATTIILGEKSNTTGTPTITSTFTQGGGLVTTGTLLFGNVLSTTGSSTPQFNAVYNLSSGTLRAANIATTPTIALTSTNTSNAASVRRIAWSAGTIANYDAATDLSISGTTTNAGYTMQLVLGSTAAPQVFAVDAGRTITVGPSAVISGTGSLQKQGAGTLRLSSANTFAGSLALGGGVTQLGIANGLSANAAVTLNPSSGTATLDMAGFNATAGSLASAGAGASVVDVTTTGTSILTVGGDNTSTTFAGRLRNSGSSAALGFTKNGTGTWTLTGSNSVVAGTLTFTNGKVSLDPGAGGSFTHAGRFTMTPASNVSATFEIVSGSNSFSTAAGIVGLGDNAATGTSTWTVSGGANTLSLSSNRLLIGNKGPGTLAVSGGSLTIAGTPDIFVGGDSQYTLNNASGFVTVSGGTLAITGSGNLLLGRNQTIGGTTSGANGTISLNGGVFATVRPITVFTGSTASTGTVNFNGGTLRALASNANFLAVTTANVLDGGAVVDTNGFSITIGQSLLASGSGGLTKNGAGTLTLSGTNTFTGSTVVNAGSLAIGSVSALPGYGTAGRFSVVSGATLAVGNAVSDADIASIAATGNIAAGGYLGFDTSAGNRTFAGSAGGALGLAKIGANALTLSASNGYTGGTWLGGGSVVLDHADALGSVGTISFAGGGLQYTANNTADYSGRFATAAGQAYSVNVNGQTVTWATSLTSTGASSFTRSGGGLLTLAGANSTIGAGLITVNGGTTTIAPGAGGSFSAAGRLIIHNATTSGSVSVLRIESGSNSFTTAAGLAGIGDAASGVGTLAIAGGETTLALVTNRVIVGNKSSGRIEVSGGAFIVTGTSDIYVGGDSQYALNNASGFVTVAGGTMAITGTGNLVLGRNQTISGTTTGAAGTISLDGGVFATARPITVFTGTNPGTGTVNFNGGTLRALVSSTSLLAVTTASVQNGGAVIDTNGFDVTLAQALQNGGSGGLTKLGAGTLTLSASNAYAGATAVAGGTLRAADLGALGTGAVTIASGATLDLNSLAIANSITNAGGSLVNAASYAGSQTLTGAATFGNVGGSIAVSNGGVATFTGTATGNLSVAAGGRADVATGGTVLGAVSLAAGGVLGGVGSVGTVSGAGLVGPGNSPGILTATDLNPAGGLSFAFEFTQAAPAYGTPSAVGNDLLWITGGTPFTAPLTGANVVNIYLSQAAAALDAVTGGFFTSNAFDFTASIGAADFRYFVAAADGTVSYNGQNYKTLADYDSSKSISISTVAENGGQVMQMVVVPEPGAMVLVATGALAFGWTAVRRLRRR